MKKRLLLCNDAHFLYSGYGKYGKELLTRLHASGKYEVAELGLCSFEGDIRMKEETPWKHYHGAVSSSDKYHKQFISNPSNKYGMWNFDDVCVDFKPDIVININDPWMMSFIPFSPARPFFHWVISPTVDSDPQKSKWLDMFYNADGVLTYSEYGKEVLERQSGNNIKVFGVASPGVDHDIFKPQNKQLIKKYSGINEEVNIIGTVMRNQPRKLYPDLFESFRKFIDLCYKNNNKGLAEKSYLYIHTCYPDNDANWNIPSLLKEFGIAKKVLLTYICGACGHIKCARYSGSRTVCPKCNTTNFVITNSNHGVSEYELASIINMFDVYIQYSSCEGFGMPQLEAAACGVPLMSVDYSAMQDLIKNCDAMPIPIKRMFRESIIDAYRALPDNDATARMIMEYFSLPNDLRNIKSKNVADLSKKYSWDKNAEIWERYIDQVELTGKQGKWKDMVSNASIPEYIPENLKGCNNSTLVNWLVSNVLHRPELYNSRFALEIIGDLNCGFTIRGSAIKPFTQELAFQRIKQLAEQHNNTIRDIT